MSVKSFTSRVAIATLTSTLALTTATHAQYSVSSFNASQWGLDDTALGIQGAAIESFEDTNLLAGLSVSVASGSGSYGPTSTLPSLMMSGPDAFGTAFVNSAWDGAHVLLNTHTNQALPYSNPANWGSVRFDLPAGTTGLGFSLQQMEIGSNAIFINGVNVGTATSFLGVETSSGRNGYFVISAQSGTIDSFQIVSASGDGFAFDHLAIIPTPGTALLLGLAGAGLCSRRRGR